MNRYHNLTEDAIASMEQFNQEAARSASLNPVEDQGQSDTQQSSQQTGSTELKTPQSNQAPDYSDITKKKEAGEKVTFKEGFSESFGTASAYNPANYLAAAGAGVTDFAIDTINILPGVSLPKLPRI